MLCRDKRLPFDTGSTSGLQETFLVINFPHLIRPKIIIKEFTTVRHQERQDQFHKRQGPGPHSQEMKSEMGAQFRCRHLREGRRPCMDQRSGDGRFIG